MERRAHFEQRGNATINIDPSIGWLQNSRNQLQQSAFAGAVSSDDSENFPLPHLKINIAQCPEFPVLNPSLQEPDRVLLECRNALLRHAIKHGSVLQLNDRSCYGFRTVLRCDMQAHLLSW